MAKIDLDLSKLPLRLTSAEVCQIARRSRTWLAAEVKAKRFPEPADYGRPNIYNRDAVLKALGLNTPLPDPADAWVMTDEIRAQLLSRKRSRPGARKQLWEMTPGQRKALEDREASLREFNLTVKKPPRKSD
jgi:hypothetical protein